MTASQFVFWISLFLLAHTYLLYPLLLRLLSSGKKQHSPLQQPEQWPLVSILMSVHNEESVLERKIDSMLQSDYPGTMEILVGSDLSTDNTNKILARYSERNSFFSFRPFETRKGKGNIINALAKEARGEILIITDADVVFTAQTVSHLVRNFFNPDAGLVDAHMKHGTIDRKGFSIQESIYLSWEVNIKNLEGKLWGTMMGPFGGCFAIRRKFFHEIPENFLADDFYLNMKILESGKKSFNDLEALVYGDLSGNLREEFRRKVRISAGNFQNLARFFHLLVPPWKPLAIAFFSHKVIRWLGPFLLVFMLGATSLLYQHSSFFRISLWIQLAFMTTPLLVFLLDKIGIQIIILRLIAHFYMMNTALLWGFFKYLKGIESNVWEPTKRSSQTTTHN
jgi:cellulose synthase/poly-beta-1,6-N-acetylglucosamine synthase-like glycosyltransferase